MYQDSEIRSYYRKVIRKIRINDRKKHGCVTAEMTEHIMDISGRKKRDVPLAQAARIRVSPNVIRRTNNNFTWSDMFGQTKRGCFVD